MVPYDVVSSMSIIVKETSVLYASVFLDICLYYAGLFPAIYIIKIHKNVYFIVCLHFFGG